MAQTPQNTPTLLAIGTRKGLWLARSDDRSTWTLERPHLLMSEVPSIGIDTRDGQTRLLVGVRSEHWGPTVIRSVAPVGGDLAVLSAYLLLALTVSTFAARRGRVWAPARVKPGLVL